MQGTEHQMTRQGSLYCNVRGLLIPDLADHDDIRILPYDAPEHGSESNTDRSVRLHLVDAPHFVLDGVFDGRDIADAVIYLLKPGVERGGLAGARWPRHEQYPVRLLQTGAI